MSNDEFNSFDRFRDMQNFDQEKKRRLRKHNIQKSENEKKTQQTSLYSIQQRIFSIFKSMRKFKHIDREKRNILHSIEKTIEKETQTFLRLINHFVDFSMKLFVKNIEQFRVNVFKNSKN